MGQAASNNPDGEEWLTVGQVAALLQVHSNTVRRLIVSRRLPAARLGGHRSTLRISSVDLAVFMTNARGNTNPSGQQ
jgi:excisionase family DNA binding protein